MEKKYYLIMIGVIFFVGMLIGFALGTFSVNEVLNYSLIQQQTINRNLVKELKSCKYENRYWEDSLEELSNEVSFLKDYSNKSYGYNIEQFYCFAEDFTHEFADIPIRRPFLPDNVILTSNYGYREHPIKKEVKYHNGVDYQLPVNTEVVSTANGVVEKTMYGRGYGNYIIVNHGTYKTLYAHLDKILVNVCDTVTTSSLIGYSGKTGLATAPHLHYEILLGDTKINPLHFYLIFKKYIV